MSVPKLVQVLNSWCGSGSSQEWSPLSSDAQDVTCLVFLERDMCSPVISHWGVLSSPPPTFCNCRGDKPEMVTLKVELSPRAVGPFIALGLGSIVFAYHLGLCQVIYL